VDIDGTLISGGRLIEKTYNYIDDMEDTEIFIVTGRNDSERDSTIAELDSLGIDYDRLLSRKVWEIVEFSGIFEKSQKVDYLANRCNNFFQKEDRPMTIGLQEQLTFTNLTFL
jgi:hypothetical protein